MNTLKLLKRLAFWADRLRTKSSLSERSIKNPENHNKNPVLR